METELNTGRIVVISGPSGVGKSTLCHRLCALLPATFSVSVTTRKPRPGERHARDYRYVSPREFERLRAGGALLEWAEVYGHCYGTPLEEVRRALDGGTTIILEIDVRGCIQVRARFPQARTFFILPPTAEEQKRRIEGRRTDAAEEIRERLARADGEIRYATESGCYDAFLVNADLDETVEQIVSRVGGRSAATDAPGTDKGTPR